MNRWELATWASVAVLVVGAPAVFLWFTAYLRTEVREWRERVGRGKEGG